MTPPRGISSPIWVPRARDSESQKTWCAQDATVLLHLSGLLSQQIALELVIGAIRKDVSVPGYGTVQDSVLGESWREHFGLQHGTLAVDLGDPIFRFVAVDGEVSAGKATRLGM